jgi:cell division protein FtsZ
MSSRVSVSTALRQARREVFHGRSLAALSCASGLQARGKSSNAASMHQKALNVFLNHANGSPTATTEKKLSVASALAVEPAKKFVAPSDPTTEQHATEAMPKLSHSPRLESIEAEAKPVPLMNVIPQEKAAKVEQRELPRVHTSPIHGLHEFAPKIVVVGVGGAGGNALNNMIAKELQGVDFLALNTDAQHLSLTLTDNRLQLGLELTQGLGCGANPDAGRLAAEESRAQIEERLSDAHMVFITAGMGGGTGTGAAPVVADICYQKGIMTVGVVTLPFNFEGTHRRRLALEGIARLQQVCDTTIIVPNQNLFAISGPETTFVDAFQMADDVLLGGVKSITDLMTSPGLINLDFADVQAVMVGMGNALLGTGVSSDGVDRAIKAAHLALDNPLLGDTLDITTAKGMLVNITGGKDMTLFEVDRAAQFITSRVKDESANIIFGSAYDASLEGSIRVSVVATGIDQPTL